MGAVQEPNNRVLEPKYYDINGTWALESYYFGSLDPQGWDDIWRSFVRRKNPSSPT